MLKYQELRERVINLIVESVGNTEIQENWGMSMEDAKELLKRQPDHELIESLDNILDFKKDES